MYLQSIKSVKHNHAKSVTRSILKKSRHIGFGVFGVFIVHSSMVPAQNLHNFSGREWAVAYIFCAVEIQTLPLEMFVF